MLGILTDPTRSVLVRAMDARAERNGVIAGNIANADTPGYKRAYVRFEETLRQMLADGQVEDARAVERLEATVEQDASPSSRLDGNNVNIDREMGDLARNSIEYNALVELYRQKGQILRTVITGGGR